MEKKYCQRCAMPMGETDTEYGTEKDGTKSKEYCHYCYENGEFTHYCQSCVMPMGQTDAEYGTEKDGSKSKDYCHYCYENGEFIFHGTMEEMIDICIPPMVENNPGMTKEVALGILKEYLPTLKRWKQA